MAPRLNGVRPVEALGRLRLDTPGGQSLSLVAEGDRLRVDVPALKEALGLMPRSFRGRRHAMQLISNALTMHGLTLDVKSADKSVFQIGHQAKPSWFARLLGLAPACIPLSAIGVFYRN